jgi:hypothetical protein
VTDERAFASQVRLRVEAVFQGVEEGHARTIAAELIDRAHELANLPDRQCDVDVSVEETAEDGEVERSISPTGTTHTHPLAR